MLIDLIAVALVAGAAAWGYSRGFRADGLALVGFGVGALLGSRLAPLVLDGGLQDPFAPVLALPAALLFGALFAAGLERFALGAQRPMLQAGALDRLLGALVAGCLGLILVWVLGGTATKVDDLRASVRDSTVIDNLNAVIPPPGPLVTAKRESDPLPIIAGPTARVRPGTAGIKRDPDVRAAGKGVAKIIALACGHNATGTGWVAPGGVVVTNAHVVQGSDEIRVQIEGRGRLQDAEPIWYDAQNDLAILRSEGIGGVKPLRIERDPEPGTLAAVLGFPGGGPYAVKPARVGRAARIAGRRVGREFVRRKVVSLRAGVRPGNSGGPAVDAGGRVVTVVFAGQSSGRSAYGIPMPVVANALRRAGPVVETGRCREET